MYALRCVEDITCSSTAASVVQQGVEANKLKETDIGYKLTCNGPGTGEIRQSLETKIRELMREGENGIIQAPTASGKTHTISATPWQNYPEISGHQPVILFSGTKDARDDALAKSQNSCASAKILEGREDACPLAGGDYDSDNNAGNDRISAPDGGEPSEWFKAICEGRGLHLSVAHGIFSRAHDDNLPCCEHTVCPAEGQWTGIPRDTDGNFEYDVLHATHPFCQVPQLIENCNVIIDEQPDFSLDSSKGWIADTVTSYLEEIEAPLRSWEALIVAITGGLDANIESFHEELEQPEISWYKDDANAHALTPGIVEAIATAEKRIHDRWVGETRYTYPTLNPYHDGPDQEVNIRIVFDESYQVGLLQCVPDFSKARSVIGLDAHPTLPKWEGNTIPSIEMNRIVDIDDLHKWRQNQRNLTIIQVEDNKNSWTKKDFNPSKVGVLCAELRRKYGNGFRTGVTAKRFEKELETNLSDVGVDNPDTLYFGKEKSVEHFGSESAGLVAGCISPSSDHIKDWIALLDKDATPRREVDDEYQGQEWVGPDANIAMEILADVREKGVLQACGRYARSPQDPDDGAVVYVLTNVLPPAYVDEVIDNIRVFGEKQKAILNYVFSSDGVKARDIVENIDVSRKYVHTVLNRSRDYPWLEVKQGAGSYNADLFYANRSPDGTVDV